MNDKDKEAFKLWGADQDGDVPLLEGPAYEAWQAACEYKDRALINGSRMKQMNEEIERLKAENQVLSVQVVLLENKVRQYQSTILELQERTLVLGKPESK